MLDVVAGSMVFLAFPWLAIEITGSAASAGLLVAITAIPGLLLAPVIGSIIDKFGRRRTAIWIELGTAFVSLFIPLAALLWEFNLPLLITIGVIRSIIGSGSITARKSFVPDVAKVAGLSLERANSIQESVFAAGFAFGPAIASFCINWFGVYNTFYVVSAVCLLAAVTLIPVKASEHKENHDDEKSLFKFAIQGFKILGTTPSVFIVLSGLLALAMIYLPTEMIVLPKHFNLIGDPQGLGLLLSAMATATAIGALTFEKLSKKFKYSSLYRFAILGIATAMVPMSFLPPYWLLLGFGILLGAAWGPLPPLVNTVIQRKIPPSMRGRVFSLEMVIWSGGPMISMLLVGIAVDEIGVQPVYMILAGLVLTAALLITLSKYMREIDTADFED